MKRLHLSGIIPAMVFSLANSSQPYAVETPVFSGPLDLLLQLIERAELDITQLALAQVTEQYLSYLSQVQEQSPDQVSSFLVIAARLLQIKSESLLPRPPKREEGEEDPGEALRNQLIIYKRFKGLAQQLAQRELSGLRTYLRQAPAPTVESAFDLDGLSLAELIVAARLVFSRQVDSAELSTIIRLPQISIREKITFIVTYIHKNPHGSFQDLLRGNGLKAGEPLRLNIIVTFLALLELVKRQMVLTRQASLFGEIEYEPSANWDEDTEFDTEFGE